MTESDILELKARILDVIDDKNKLVAELETMQEVLNSFATEVIVVCGLTFSDSSDITTSLVIEKLKEKLDYKETQQDVEE